VPWLSPSRLAPSVDERGPGTFGSERLSWSARIIACALIRARSPVESGVMLQAVPRRTSDAKVEPSFIWSSPFRAQPPPGEEADFLFSA
jgi:hypothetical protein